MRMLPLFAAVLFAAPLAAAGQEFDVSRRSYTFLDDRLLIEVATEAPGALRVMRGERGRVEVAGRARHGFVGFALASEPARRLSLTSVGGEEVEYLVVVPEHVHFSVNVPGGPAMAAPANGLYRWGATSGAAPAAATEPLLPTRNGLLVLHEGGTPGIVDIPDLRAVRSLSVRFQGEQFRVIASRTLPVEATGGTLRIGVSGDPVDIVVYVPRQGRGLEVRGGGRSLVHSAGGRPGSGCSGVAVQEPTVHQIWFTFYPRSGRPLCG